MGILGKILIVLNLLGAGGVVYLATLDWDIRQKWAFSAFSHELRVKGLPVEAPSPAPTNLDRDYVPFVFKGESGDLTEIKRTSLATLIPPGNDKFGSGAVANQEEEVKRLFDQLFAAIDKLDGNEARRTELHTLLLNLAESGADRDGVNALLQDLFDANRATTAREDLAFLGRIPSQRSAISTLIALSNYKKVLTSGANPELVAATRDFARTSLTATALADYPNTITIPAAGTREQRYAQQEELAKNRRGPLEKLVKDSLALNANDATLEPLRTAVVNSGADDTERNQLVRIASLAGNLLENEAKVDSAIKQIAELLDARSVTPAEKAAYANVVTLITDANVDVATVAVEAGKNFLKHRFEDAMLPIEQPQGISPTLRGREVQQEAEKRRKIAHLLFFIDNDQPWTNRDAWHRRVSAIVGIEYYADVVEAQASRVLSAALRIEQLIANDQATFESQFTEQVRQARDLFEQFTVVQNQLLSEQQVVEQYQIDVNQRQGERDTLINDLARSKKDANDNLTNFRKKQDELLAITIRLRETQDSISKLESEIRRLEVEIKNKK